MVDPSKLKWTDVVKPADMSVGFLWTIFAAAVIPDVSEIQRSEMRKAFYAGFSECLRVMHDYAGAELPEEQAAQLLERMAREANEFVLKLVADVRAGSTKP